MLAEVGEEPFNDFLPEGGARKALHFRRPERKMSGVRSRSQMESREKEDRDTAQRLCG